MFAGTFTALVTPFRDDCFDESAFTQLVEAQVAGGVTGVVPVGTTGESPTVTHDEHLRIIELAVQTAAGRVKVMAGTGSNCTAEAVEYTCAAERLGADAALIVAPYYNKPTQEGLYRHFRAIADKTRLPIMLYSIPGRCGVEIAVETCARLAAECANLTVSFMKEGAVGVVSVASNVIPREVSSLVSAALAGRWQEAQTIHEKYAELFSTLFIETNPSPTKQALAWQGRMTPDVRLPLCEVSPPSQDKLRAVLKGLQLV
jgi:4-hydroxy-tetrahydrodipicolinate synthase